jgi:predicted SAM-dependent methyltransferase
MYVSVTNLPYSDKSVDVVTCVEISEHLDRQSFTAALHELRRVRGFLVVTVPYDEHLRRKLGDSAPKWVVTNRDWRIIANDVSELYRELIKK